MTRSDGGEHVSASSVTTRLSTASPSPALGRRLADDPAVAHRHHPLGGAGDAHVVRHEHDRLAVGVALAQDRHDLAGGGGVEVAGRLVGEQDARAVDQRAGDRDALLLAAGEVAGDARGGVGEAEALEQLRRAAAGLAGRDAGQQRGQLDVVGDREVRDQVEELEHEADLAAAQARAAGLVGAGQVLALHAHLAAGRAVEAAEQVEQRRLAAAARPGDGDELAVRHPQVDVRRARSRPPAPSPCTLPRPVVSSTAFIRSPFRAPLRSGRAI